MLVQWERIPDEPDTHVARTLYGTIRISLTRGYPRARTYRVQHNGETVESFIANLDMAKRRAELYVNRLANQAR